AANSKKGSLTPSLRWYLTTPLDLASQIPSDEASDSTGAHSPAFSPATSPAHEDRDWGRLLQALPTCADLAAASNTLQASIRLDIQGLGDRLGAPIST
ncbi:Hypothetical predicted protein, partial [Pelobates cultripes]